jgi:transcription initiation factor TFIIIB Brf1 subunit/transcription initiation factor TFIIB
MDEISKWFVMDKKKVAKGCKQSREALFQKHPECLKQLQPQTPEAEIKRIQNILGEVHPSWIESAQELAKFAQEFGIGLRAVPTSLAVGCLWWIYQEANAPWTMNDIAQATACSEVTVQKSWSMLVSHKETIEVFRKIRPLVQQRTNIDSNPRNMTQNTNNNSNWVKWMHQQESSLGNAQ